MPANTAPIFPVAPKLFQAKVVLECSDLAMTAGPGTYNMGQAGANGARVDYVEVCSQGANSANVLRLYTNNGSSTATAANNFILGEFKLPAAIASSLLPMHEPLIFSIQKSVPPNWYVFACVGTAPTNAWNITGYGGDY